MSVNVGMLKEFIKDMDDDITLHTVHMLGMIPSIKHVHLATFRECSKGAKNKQMLVFCSMGNHLPEHLNLIKGAN
jgi:hypothetical protein